VKAGKRALFVTYGGGHVAMVLPIIRALQASAPEVECLLMALTTGYLRAKAQTPTLGYADFLHLTDRDQALAWGERLAGGNFSPDVPAAETLAYLGANYLDLEARMGAPAAAAHYAQHGRYGFHPIGFMGRVIDELRPSVVVATNSPRSEAAAIEAAVARGIPSVGMVDLFGVDNDPFVSRRPRPDLTFVLAPPVKERLVSRGFEPEQVVVTGNPAFDGLWDSSVLDAARAYREALGWGGLKIVLWAGSRELPPPGAPADWDELALGIDVERRLRAWVASRPDVALVVRYHPSEWHLFPTQPAQERVHVSLPAREPIHPLLQAISALVLQNSTVGVEANMAGKPVISLEYAPSATHTFSLHQLGVAHPCASADSLIQTVEAQLAAPQAPVLNLRSDGRAADRAVGHIWRLLQGKAAQTPA
jgi:hypothetical protein